MSRDLQLRQLARKWRNEADGVTAMGYSQQGDRMRDCAAELEQLLDGERPSYVCPFCFARSYNPNDIQQQYCGACHRFADPLGP